MKKLGFFTLCLLIMGAPSHILNAQEKKSKKEQQKEQAEKVQKLVELQNYTFVAQYAQPMTGGSINLTSEYDLKVGLDAVTAYLPYFGRAYVAPIDPTEGGIKFNSTDFDYRLNKNRKGGWTAFININDGKQGIQMTLNIASSGSAILSVSDNNRQSISFNGHLAERK